MKRIKNDSDGTNKAGCAKRYASNVRFLALEKRRVEVVKNPKEATVLTLFSI